MKGLYPLVGIVICVFMFNMSEFMPVGLLTGISEDLGVSESQAGLIISFYAWAVALISLPIMLLLRRMEYRRMLLLCVALFTLFQALSGLSTDYWMLMASRIGVAVAHSIFWSIATPLAVNVVEKGYQRLAIGCVATGTSIAMIVGLPLGRVIGLALGWRMTFLVIALIALATLVFLIVVFPRMENPGTFTVKRVPEIFRNRKITGMYIALILVVTGIYTGYSFIEPFLKEFGGFSEDTVTIALTVYGAAGILGSILFSKLYADHRFSFMAIAFAGNAAALYLLGPTVSVVLALMAVMAFWGICATSFNVSFQNELLKASPSDASPIVMSLYSGLFNVGIASGSMIGGFVTDMSGVQDISVVGALFALVATVFVVTYLIKTLKKDESDPLCASD